MITISNDLQTAAEAESRAPLFGVDVIKKRLDFALTEHDPSLASVVVHRVVKSSNGFWVASGYPTTGVPPTTIYAKKITTLLSSDWESGWQTVITNVPNAHYHDLYVDGDDAVIAFWDDGASGEPEIWYSTSSNGGSTWGSATLFQDPGLTSDEGVLFVSIEDDDPLTIWWACGADYNYPDEVTLYKKSGGYSLIDFTDLISNTTFDFMASDYGNSQYWKKHGHVRPISGDDYAVFLAFNSIKGYKNEDKWTGVFCLQAVSEHSTGSSCVSAAMGCLETNLDYTMRLCGLSRDTFGGYYVGGVLETYNEYADVGGTSEVEEFYICRTKDGIAYELIPTNVDRIFLSFFTSLYTRGPDDTYISGVTEDTDGTLVFFITSGKGSPRYTFIMTTDASWLAGGETGTAVEDDVLENISISRTAGQVSKTEIVLSNNGDTYTDSALVTEGNIVRVEAGYKTASGDELQRRFTGEIVNVNQEFGADKRITLDVYDTLFPATLKAGRVHVLFGGNTFIADFSQTDDDKKIISQNGLWAISGSYLQQTLASENAFALCGYDPDDSYTIVVKFRVNTSITDTRTGIVVGYDPDEGGNILYTVVCYNETTDNIEYGYVDNEGVYNLISTAFSSLGWSADTDYWLRVNRSHNLLRSVSYKTSESGEWEYNAIVDPEELGPKTYPGLYSYLPSASSSASFSSVLVVSHRKQLTGSEVMKYLATSCGIDTDEKVTIDDGFAGSAFSSDWTEGPYGSWTITSGYAQGSGNALDPTEPAEACVNTFTASDIQATAYLEPQYALSGISLRSDCNENRYEGVINYFGYQIAKVVDGVRTILDWTYDSGNTWWITSSTCRVDFAAIGQWLLLYVNYELIGIAYDDEFESGFVGIISLDESPTNQSYHTQFIVDGHYIPIPGIITIDAKDTFMSVLTQTAEMVPETQFFCNEDGALRWGIFPEDGTPDLDVENVIIQQQQLRGVDAVRTNKSLVGDLLYANTRIRPWAIRLSRHVYDSGENKFVKSGKMAHEIVRQEILDSHRIKETSLVIAANPALEIGDIVTMVGGTIYLSDTFTDTTSTLLENHDPDTDLAGNGWVKNTIHFSDSLAISADDTVGAAVRGFYEVDIEQSNLVVEVDFKTASTGSNAVGLTFRGDGTDYLSMFLMTSGAVLGGWLDSKSFTLDFVDGNELSCNEMSGEWLHMKVVIEDDNVFGIITARSETILLFGTGVSGFTGTRVGIYLGGPGEADDLVAYSPDQNGQLLSIVERIGSSYEMELPDVIGNREYW